VDLLGERGAGCGRRKERLRGIAVLDQRRVGDVLLRDRPYSVVLGYSPGFVGTGSPPNWFGV
jgi:hypothetical protein